MAKQKKSSNFAELIHIMREKFGDLEVKAFIGYQKLSDKNRKGKIFLGKLTQLPREEKPEGFENPCQVATFDELSIETREVIGEIEIICQADLSAKLKNCMTGKIYAIAETGTQKIKGRPQLMICYTVLEVED